MSSPEALTISFDHHSRDHVFNAQNTYRKLRDTAPVAWSSTYGGFWVVSRYEEAMDVSNNKERYLSAHEHGGVNIPTLADTHLIPTESDGADWERYRRVLAPNFTPKALRKMQLDADVFADALIDRHIESGEMDLVKHLANPVPALATMQLVGFPLENWEEFAEPVHVLSWAPVDSPEWKMAREGIAQIHEHVIEELARQRKNPGNSLIGYMVKLEADRAGVRYSSPKLADEEIIDLIMQVIYGGIDTTTALTSNALYHLSEDLHSREVLQDDPTKIRVACEEFMRFYTPLQGLARTAACDFELGGQQIRKGDRIMVLWASANRDEAQFDDPDEFRVERFPNKHMSFGIGPHRCIGSNLARILFDSMIRKVLQRLPDYRIDMGKAKHYPSLAVVNSWSALPSEFTPGKSGGTEIRSPK